MPARVCAGVNEAYLYDPRARECAIEHSFPQSLCRPNVMQICTSISLALCAPQTWIAATNIRSQGRCRWFQNAFAMMGIA